MYVLGSYGMKFFFGSFQDRLVGSKYKYFFWTDDSPLTTLVTLQLVVAKWSGAMLTHQMH